MKNTKNVGTQEATKDNDEEFQLEEFFLNSLKGIYGGENHLLKIFPKMVRAATTQELRDVLTDHLEVCMNQITKLENVFDVLDEKAQAKKCEAIEGLTREAEDFIEETREESMTRDVALIMAVQKIRQYKIATYSNLVRLSASIEQQEAENILTTILDEETEADMILTGVVEGNITIQ